MKKFKLKNIDCSICAVDIEKSLTSIEGVNYASININSSTLLTDLHDLNKLRQAIQKIHPDAQVEEFSNTNDKNDSFKSFYRSEIFRIAIGIPLFAAGIMLQNFTEADFSAIYFIMIATYLISGWSVLNKAVNNIIRGKVFDENFLMSIATLGAIGIGELTEAVAVMIFYNIGEFFQNLALHRSRSSIKSLLSVRPDNASLLVGNEVKTIKPEQIKIGDILIVKPGEKIPIDGIVIEGNSFIDSYPLTGESVPVEVTVNDNVLAGTINNSGLIKIKALKPIEESSIAKIMELVENAQIKKAKTEKFITTFAHYYTPPVVFGALAIAVVPPLLFTGQTFDDWIYRALVILVISCPCALVISIPLGYFGGIGGASRRGILVKGSNFLDALTEVSTVVFDKTGTLTKGVFKVTEIVQKNGFEKEEVLKYAAIAESHSNHPIAKSILDAAVKVNINPGLTSIREIRGEGVIVEFDNKQIVAGNDRLLHRTNIEHDVCSTYGTTVHVAIDNNYAGYIIISDEVKDGAKNTLNDLKKSGMKNIVMLTGDSESVAKYVSEKLNIDQYYAELLPEDKVAVLEKLKDRLPFKEKICFIGDGINDAPVLARADVGIAMGALGSDAAVETADIVIMSDDLRKVNTSIQIARKTRKIVWQNISFALGVKFIFILMGGFGLASMWEAVFADMGVALLAILNATRVLR